MFVAGAIGAPGPLLAGEVTVLVVIEIRCVSNAEAKRELGWQRRWSAWRVGFAKGLGE